MDYDERWQRHQERWARKQERWKMKQERWEWKRQQWAQGHHPQWHFQNAARSGVVFSVAIIALGALFLMDNLGIVRFHDVARWWPAILIALGVVRLVDSHGTGSIVWGGLLAGAGSLLLLDNLNIVVFDWRIFWPAILIGWGVLMLIRATQWSHQPPPPPEGAPAAPASQPGKINFWTMFANGERRIDAQDFRGGEISTMFGGHELDLRGARMAEGECTIDISLMFGGVEIQIPSAWQAEVRGTALFGAFVDETRPPQTDGTTPPPKLIVTGYAMFGGVSITN